MELRRVQSRATVMPAHERIDPYWSGMWNVGSSAAWYSRDTLQRMLQQGLIDHAPQLERSVEDACLHVVDGRRRLSRMAGMAVVQCFNTVTDEQMACFTGEPMFANRSSDMVSTMVGTGLVAEGSVPTPGRNQLPRLLRPIGTGKPEKLFSLMGRNDLTGVSHGQPWTAGATHDRHNMFATELLLRLAEYTEVPLVLGEQLAKVSTFIGRDSFRAGDGLFVRGDGSVVIVEMTATVNRNFPDKVLNWVEALSMDRGLSVLFVDVSHPDRSDRSVMNQIRKQVRRHASTMSASMMNVDKRIMVAKWSDWFPAAGEVDPGFFSLHAERQGSNGWESVEIMDPFDFSPPSSEVGRALLDNAPMLYGIPHWQRGVAR